MRQVDDFLPPMLAVTAPRAFSSPDWWFEIKWDGFRALAHTGRQFHVFSRSGRDLLADIPALTALRDALPDDVIVDGELLKWVDGQSAFFAIRHAGPGCYVLVVFDCLYARGQWLLDQPLTRRQEVLRRWIHGSPKVVVADGLVGEGEAYFQAAWDLGLEGVMAKRLTSPYEPGRRSDAWQKFLVLHQEDLWVAQASQTGAGDWWWAISRDPQGREVVARLRAPKNWPTPASGSSLSLDVPIRVQVEYRQRTGRGRLRHARIRQWAFSD
ncbi:MAG: DNA ligase [Firmicutes bacterium]|nr:DNA ligase [Bacillota bacterium]